MILRVIARPPSPGCISACRWEVCQPAWSLPGRRLAIGTRSFMLAASDRCCSFPLLLAGLPQQAQDHGPTARARLPRATAAGIHPLRSALGVTARLWVSYFFTLLVVYLLLNWLPSLAMSAGYSHLQATLSSIMLNAGAVLGSLALGALTDKVVPRNSLIVAYLGMAASLLVLALGHGAALFAGAFLAGFFVIGGQLILYAMAPAYALSGRRARNRRRPRRVAARGDWDRSQGPVLAGLWLSHGFPTGYRPTDRGPRTAGRLHRGPHGLTGRPAP